MEVVERILRIYFFLLNTKEKFFFVRVLIHLPWQHHQFSIYFVRKCWPLRRLGHLRAKIKKFLWCWGRKNRKYWDISEIVKHFFFFMKNIIEISSSFSSFCRINFHLSLYTSMIMKIFILLSILFIVHFSLLFSLP